MWGVLQEQDEKFKIGAKFQVSNLTMELPNGSRLQLFGADMKNFIRRLKGIKTPGAGIDEAQDFGPHLESLVNDVFGPAILDYEDGWLGLAGTPGPVPHGFFYEASELKKYGFSIHQWSLFQNPYLPNPKAFVLDLKKKKGWDDNNATLRREYFNEWVFDLDALVFKYQAERNHFDALPEVRGEWRYVIGVDLGFNDADAIAVIAWSDKLQAAYLVEEVLEREQGITELALSIERLIKKYNPERIVMDYGGLGKKIAEEIRRRYQLPILAAEKSRKLEYIELLNDAMRTGKFFAKKNSLFASDAARVKWDYEKSTPDKLAISDVFHSDICDAVLYAFRDSLHWTFEPEAKAPKVGTPEHYKAQEDEIIERLEEELEEERLERQIADPFEWDEL